MNKDLYNWLEKEWRFNNHVKYQKYFKEWISNLTPDQITGFTKQYEQGLNVCIYHRLIIYYLFLTFAILALDSMVVLPISVFTFNTILLTISGITLIAVIITYLKYGDRKISQKDKLTD